MEIPIDFSKKVDLVHFRQQALKYIGRMREFGYRIYTPGHKILITTVTVESEAEPKHHRVTIAIFDVVRNKDGVIVQEPVIFPITDERFKSFPEAFSHFTLDHYKASFESSDVETTVNKLCDIITLVNRIQKLKAFT